MLTIGHLLSGAPVLCLPPSASVMEAAQAMTRMHVAATMITDGDRRPLGVFTERDLMGRVVVPGRDPWRVRLEEVMSRDLYLARPGDTFSEVKEEVQRRHIRHIPVVGLDGRFIAMLSFRDLLRDALDERTHEVEALTEYIHGTSRGEHVA